MDEKSLGTAPDADAFPPVVRISAKYGDGIETLAVAIRRLALDSNSGDTPSAVIAHAHQRASLEKAKASLQRAAEGLSGDTGMPPEIVALEIREAIDSIGEITGKTSNEAILDHIFSRFCIGK
jgi:tRNA modification GTPase